MREHNLSCSRSRGESSVFVLDSKTSECLHYEHIQGFPRTSTITIPREILTAHPEIDIRNDLIDCCIDVCSVEVIIDLTISLIVLSNQKKKKKLLSRFFHCFKTTLIISISEETLFMGF